MIETGDKQVRNVFVIMPFTATPTRKQANLTAFFNFNLKDRIERESSLAFRYVVSRSADAFLINDTILTSLYRADVVLCDLSGEHANPNVMFELGVRLALTHKPVIMIREEHPSNRPIFDVQSYYIHPYSPLQYKDLEDFVIRKLREIEAGREPYQSPVLKTLQYAPQLVERLRHGDAVRRMRMFLTGIESIHGRLAGDVATFLKPISPVPIPSDIVGMTETLVQHVNVLRALDWSGFQFRAVRVQALEAYLVDPIIVGLIPPDVETDFTLYVGYFFDTRASRGQVSN